jgi:hypothetical protein
MLPSCCRYGEHLYVFSQHPSSVTRQQDHNLLFLSYCLRLLCVHHHIHYICLITQKRLLKLVKTENFLFSRTTRHSLGLIQPSINL